MNRQILLRGAARTDIKDRKSDFGRVATVLLVTAMMAGCAANPEDIAPEFIDESRYQNLNCEQFQAERSRVEADLTTASARQKEKRSDDVAGVIFLALPLGSMSSDEDLEPEIARLKGERDALDRGAKLKNCDNVTAKKNSGNSSTR